jgi:hypothetical protein
MFGRLSRHSICAATAAIVGVDAMPCFAQGYTVGGSRPSQNQKIKLHAELASANERHVVSLPKLGLAIPAHPTLELGIDAQLRHIDAPGKRRVSGLGDIELKAKYLLVDGHSSRLGIDASAELKVSVPIGDERRGFGDGQPAIKLPVTFSRRHGPWEFGGLIGGQLVHRRNKAMLLAGALVTRELGGGVKVGGEIATEMRYKDPGTQELMANLGLRFRPSAKSELFLIAGRSLESKDREPVIRFKLGLEIILD